MDIIEQYVNALFAKLPASLEILHLRDDVLEEARASYARLCEDGLDRDAAVGRVLSRLGSLDEILARHGISASVTNPDSAAAVPSEPFVTDSEALSDETEDYLDAQYNITRMIALGVGLCICSPIFPLFFDNSFPILGHWIGDGLGAVGFFGAIALAVMLYLWIVQMRFVFVPSALKRLQGAKDLAAEGKRIAARAHAAVDWLADIAAVAPLVGLLGTVLGMFQAFGGIASDVSAGAKPVVLAQGVSQAIVTTIFGLVVAIPALVAYAFFRRRCAKRIAELEEACEEIAVGGGAVRK